MGRLVTRQQASSTSVQTDKIIKISIIDNLPEIPINSNEGYKLKITEKQIYVTATSSTGVYRALQTIQQLTCKSNEYHFFLPVRLLTGLLFASGDLCMT